MKNIAIKISLVSILIAGVAAVSAFGQSTQYRGNIPFDFTARGVKMKAGEYTLASYNNGLLLRDRKRGTASVLGATGNGLDSSANTKGKLTFIRDGDSYVLTEVDTPAYSLRVKHTATSVNVAKASKPEKVEVNIAAGN